MEFPVYMFADLANRPLRKLFNLIVVIFEKSEKITES